jgi:hypothetical protein
VVKRAGARFTEQVKQTYRVFLTLAMKRLFVYLVHEPTRHFVQGRREGG